MKYPIPAKSLEQNILVLGKTRSGKSSAMRSIVEPMLEDKPAQPPCIVDPKGDWWGLKSGYEIVIFGGSHADVVLTEHMGAALAEIVATSVTATLLDLSEFTVGQRTRFFIEFAAAFFKLHRGQRKLIIDEVHNFAPQGKVYDPQSGLMLHWANRLASEGSGRGITLIAASQRPQKVHKDFVTSMETLIAKKVIHKLDRDAVKDWIDGCGDPEQGKKVLASLAQLKRNEGWVWSPEIEFGPECVTFPMFRTYDSFKPQPAEIDVSGWRRIQVDEIRERLSQFVQQQEANDPRMLRKRIADLEAQLQGAAGLTQQQYAEDIDSARKAAQREGYNRGYRDGQNSVKQSAIDKACEAEGMLKRLSNHANEMALQICMMEIPEPPPPVHVPPSPMAKTFTTELAKANVAASRAFGEVAPKREGGLQRYDHTAPTKKPNSPAAHRILDVIHRTYPVWISFDAAARRAGVSKTSSAYRKYYYQVAESGEVEGLDGKLRSLPEFAQTGPMDGTVGVDAWAANLPPSYGKMLQAIAEHGGGRGITKDRIAHHAGVSQTSSGLGAGLAELRRLELVDETNGLYTLAEGLR